MASLPTPTSRAFIRHNNYQIDCATDDGFNHTATKSAYLHKMSQVYNYSYINPAYAGEKLIARSETVSRVIEAIENYQTQCSSTLDNPHDVISSDLGDELVTALVSTYKVIYSKGRKSLVRLKINTIQKKTITVLGFDNAFEVLSETHRKYGHCNGTKLEKLLKDEYQIPEKCYKLFSEFCNVCQKNSCFGKNVRVILIREKMHTVLVYQDAWSNYILLRAISSKIHYLEEVTIELLKIFTDFGVPDKMDVIPKKEFYTSVLEDINKFLPCEIDVQNAIRFHHDDTVKKILDMLENWKKSSNSEDWAFACYAVQVQWNNTKPEPEIDCPYKKVFGDLNMGKNWPSTSSSEVVPDSEGIPTIELD